MEPEYKSDETKGDEIEIEYLLLSQLEDVADEYRVPLDLDILFHNACTALMFPILSSATFVISPSAV